MKLSEIVNRDEWKIMLRNLNDKTVLYASDEFDITDELIEYMNKTK